MKKRKSKRVRKIKRNAKKTLVEDANKLIEDLDANVDDSNKINKRCNK